MKPLGFGEAICRSDQGFSLVAAFDDYFCYSGKKYRVIDTCEIDGKKGHRVKAHYDKPNVLLNVLKAISIATIVIPIIMFIGKLIARSQYSFFIDEGKKSRKTNEKNEKQPVGDPPVGEKEEINGYAKEFKEFKQKALATFQKAQLEPTNPDFTLTEEQKQSLDEAIKSAGNRKIEGVRVIKSGAVNLVYFLDKIPGFVFKVPRSLDDENGARVIADNYVAIVEKARQEIETRNLYLLKVPEAKVVEINGKPVVMQEKVDLISGDYFEQKAIYSQCWNDEEMKDYMKTLFSQVLEFIVKTGFSDVKYDNIPFSNDGKVSLIDLDRKSAIDGLIKGRTLGKDGLFNLIQFEYLDEFLLLAKAKLEEEPYKQLAAKFDEFKERAQNKATKDKEYSQHLKKNVIASSTKKISTDIPKLFGNDANKQKYALWLIDTLNQKLSVAKSASIQVGRTVSLSILMGDPVHQKAQEIWGADLRYVAYEPDAVSFKSTLKEVLTVLRDNGYIHKYKIIAESDTAKMVC